MHRNIGEIPARLLHSPAETERLLGLSHASVYRLLRAGKLVAVKLGGRTGITRESIERVAAGGDPSPVVFAAGRCHTDGKKGCAGSVKPTGPTKTGTLSGEEAGGIRPLDCRQRTGS